MKLLLILLISISFGYHTTEKHIVTKEDNVTTIQIGTKIYKSAESEIGEAWIDIKNK